MEYWSEYIPCFKYSVPIYLNARDIVAFCIKSYLDLARRLFRHKNIVGLGSMTISFSFNGIYLLCLEQFSCLLEGCQVVK